MNRQEYFRQAKITVERRQQAAETRAIHRREEIYAQIPELALLDEQKTIAGAEAARLAADGFKKEAEEKLALVHDIGKRKKLMLAQHKIAEDELQPKYHCPYCNDSGRKGDEICQCVLTEVKRMRRQHINEAGPLSLCRFENFSMEYYPEAMADSVVNPKQAMEAIFEDCKAYAQDFGPRVGSLFMYGDAGLGKTHLALSIASEVLEKGYDVIYVSAQSAFAEITNTRFEQGGGTLFESMLEADLLVLDDLGTEYLDAYVMGRLYELINGRTRKPTIYTTNITRQDLLYQRYTEKIASRLLGQGHLMRFWGKDIRLQTR